MIYLKLNDIKNEMVFIIKMLRRGNIFVANRTIQKTNQLHRSNIFVALEKDKNKFRAIRELENGYFIEVNLSSQSIQKLCYQAMETIELTSDEWEVETR